VRAAFSGPSGIPHGFCAVADFDGIREANFGSFDVFLELLSAHLVFEPLKLRAGMSGLVCRCPDVGAFWVVADRVIVGDMDGPNAACLMLVCHLVRPVTANGALQFAP